MTRQFAVQFVQILHGVFIKTHDDQEVSAWEFLIG